MSKLSTRAEAKSTLPQSVRHAPAASTVDGGRAILPPRTNYPCADGHEVENRQALAGEDVDMPYKADTYRRRLAAGSAHHGLATFDASERTTSCGWRLRSVDRQCSRTQIALYHQAGRMRTGTEVDVRPMTATPNMLLLARQMTAVSGRSSVVVRGAYLAALQVINDGVTYFLPAVIGMRSV